MNTGLYNFFVRKNKDVQAEYERYVQEHLVEHYENRLRQWKILWKLNWHYRIKKCSDPMLYFDIKNVEVVNPIIENNKKAEVKAKKNDKQKEKTSVKEKTNVKENKTKNQRLPYMNGAESRAEKWMPPADLLRKLMNYDIISFDIFDTLIFRPFEKPQDLFYFLEEELNSLRFYNVRKEAEIKLRDLKQEREGHREIYLEEIYEYIEKETGINAEYGKEKELELEREFCFANPYMKYVLDTLIANGKRVILISDMYIKEQEIENILDKCHFYGFEKIFISCDYKCNKRDGKLYEKVKEYINNETLTWIHVGDNEISDIQSAEKNGIETHYYKNVNKKGGIYRTDEIKGIVGSAYRGIVNQHLHNGYQRYDAYYEYGYIYGGLFALGFANYIHQYALAKKIDNVIFVARDGYILKKVYDLMFKDIHTDYMLCSRISNLKMSSYVDKAGFLKEFVYRYIREKKDITIKELFENMDLVQLLDDDTRLFNVNEIFSEDNLNVVLDFIEMKWDEIQTIYYQEIRVSKEYYKEFFEGRKRVAIVDIGWRGQAIIALKNLERDFWKFGCEITGILAGSAPTLENLGQLTYQTINTYMFSPIKNRDCFEFHSKNSINNILTELFVGAPSPSFKGIVAEEDGYRLEFDVPELNNYEYITKIHQGILDFVNKWSETFANKEFMFDISGHDAYMPMKHIFKDYSFIKRFFKNYEFQDTVGGTGGQKSKTMKDIFNKFNL